MLDLMIDFARKSGRYFQLKLDLGLPEYYFLNPEHMCSLYSGITYYDSEYKEFGITSFDYHPAFTALRKHLGSTGKIQIEPGHNADTVLVPFYLNNHLMEVGERFLSPGAMKNHEELTENYNNGLVAEGI